MTDVLGFRKVFAVIGPSTNTVVQPELDAMRPPGVTAHYRAIPIEDPAEPLDDKAFMTGAAGLGSGLIDALRAATSCRPDHLVLGVSIVSFAGGPAGAERLVGDVRDRTGLPISVGSIALVNALRAFGGLRRVALLTPYHPAANSLVRAFLEASGFEVRRDMALKCSRWTDIARVQPDASRAALRELDGDDVDALVQVGTNLPFAALAAEAERALGKPVIAVNTATWWHALRASGIADRVDGCGRLLAEH